MSKQGFHWRRIENSEPLKLLFEMLKEADGPLTGMEIQLEAQKRATWIANPSTSVDEIGENPGYKTSGGVRFPDGKYRYWLLDAPGWAPRWKLVPIWDEKIGKKMVDYKIVRRGSEQWHEPAAAPLPGDIENKEKCAYEPSDRECLGCGEKIEVGVWHNEECKRKWRENYGIPEEDKAPGPAPAQGRLLWSRSRGGKGWE